MKCDNCYNYKPCPSGVDDGYYRACKADLSREQKQAVMDEKIKNCKEYEKL